jgi:DNA-binding XRE family transcriptional regulator
LKCSLNQSLEYLMYDLTIMKIEQATVLSPTLLSQAQHIGVALARLRMARGVKQADAALRAGISRNTAYRLEHGDPGLAIGQVLRYLDAIAPGSTLLQLLTQSDPALTALAQREQSKRVRSLSAADLEALNF